MKPTLLGLRLPALLRQACGGRAVEAEPDVGKAWRSQSECKRTNGRSLAWVESRGRQPKFYGGRTEEAEPDVGGAWGSRSEGERTSGRRLTWMEPRGGGVRAAKVFWREGPGGGA